MGVARTLEGVRHRLPNPLGFDTPLPTLADPPRMPPEYASYLLNSRRVPQKVPACIALFALGEVFAAVLRPEHPIGWHSRGWRLRLWCRHRAVSRTGLRRSARQCRGSQSATVGSALARPRTALRAVTDRSNDSARGGSVVVGGSSPRSDRGAGFIVDGRDPEPLIEIERAVHSAVCRVRRMTKSLENFAPLLDVKRSAVKCGHRCSIHERCQVVIDSCILCDVQSLQQDSCDQAGSVPAS